MRYPALRSACRNRATSSLRSMIEDSVTSSMTFFARDDRRSRSSSLRNAGRCSEQPDRLTAISGRGLIERSIISIARRSTAMSMSSTSPVCSANRILSAGETPRANRSSAS